MISNNNYLGKEGTHVASQREMNPVFLKSEI